VTKIPFKTYRTNSDLSSSSFVLGNPGVGIEKAVIDRTDRLIPLSCMEVEDENDDEDENDWGRKQAGKARTPISSRRGRALTMS
jgi:hypothetical protein